jgi:hypothetical protein
MEEKGKLIRLGKEGDVKIEWSRNNQEEIRTAKEVFDSKIKAGWTAFREKGGAKGEKIKVFDECAERIILVPQISGGCQ